MMNRSLRIIESNCMLHVNMRENISGMNQNLRKIRSIIWRISRLLLLSHTATWCGLTGSENSEVFVMSNFSVSDRRVLMQVILNFKFHVHSMWKQFYFTFFSCESRVGCPHRPELPAWGNTPSAGASLTLYRLEFPEWNVVYFITKKTSELVLLRAIDEPLTQDGEAAGEWILQSKLLFLWYSWNSFDWLDDFEILSLCVLYPSIPLGAVVAVPVRHFLAVTLYNSTVFLWPKSVLAFLYWLVKWSGNKKTYLLLSTWDLSIPDGRHTETCFHRRECSTSLHSGKSCFYTAIEVTPTKAVEVHGKCCQIQIRY